MSERKRYVIVGTGVRAYLYIKALVGKFKDVGELAGFCDVNQTRMNFHNQYIQEEDGHPPVPTYKAEDFDRMVHETRADIVIVCTIDRLHHKYIIRAMELGCDVISEKPMTVDAEKCQMIMDTVKRTGKKLAITFNYRYAPRNSKVKEFIKSGAVGEILSMHFEWLLDTEHGADYFRRWHRDKRNSGGLMVHKSTHHFDLVNWWLASSPKTVFAMGDLRFYGKENAEKRGVKEFYSRARGSEVAARDPFALKVTEKDIGLNGLYYNAEHEDHYYRDQSVFGEGISSEDNVGVMVKYHNQTVMTYSLNAHCPWEGYRVMFNGTKGRLEFNVVERLHVKKNLQEFNTVGMRELDMPKDKMVPVIIFQPHWGKAQVVDFEQGSLGGHGGADPKMLEDIFYGAGNDPLCRAAGYIDGVKSILTGIAANQSMRTGLPVEVDGLVEF